MLKLLDYAILLMFGVYLNSVCKKNVSLEKGQKGCRK